MGEEVRGVRKSAGCGSLRKEGNCVGYGLTSMQIPMGAKMALVLASAFMKMTSLAAMRQTVTYSATE